MKEFLRQLPLTALMLIANFCSGAAVMIVELSGARLIAPIVGSSLYTWSALIGVILIALSVGGWIGGYLADRVRNGLATLALIFVITAITILLTNPLAILTRSLFLDAGLVAGPLALSTLLFGAPALLQGLILPLATRVLSMHTGDRHVGLAVGLTGGAGSIGSFVGTLATGFVLVPSFSLQAIFAGVAGGVLVLAMICYYAGYRVWRPTGARAAPSISEGVAVAVMLSIALVLFTGVRTEWSESVRMMRQSPYHLLTVLDERSEDGRTIRRLLHDQTTQGYLDLTSGDLPRSYQRSWRIVEAYREGPLESALVAGGGSFGIPQAITKRYPGARVEVVEIDPVVVETAREWFSLDAYPNIEVTTNDFRRFVNRDDRVWDLVFIDTYNGRRNVPAHLVTADFFSQVRLRLAEDGVLMLNLIGSVEEPSSAVFDAVVTTLRSVFDQVDVYVATERGESDSSTTNLTIVAGDALGRPARGDALADAELAEFLGRYVPPARYRDRDAPVLTDDRNPIELLIAKGLRAEP